MTGFFSFEEIISSQDIQFQTFSWFLIKWKYAILKFLVDDIQSLKLSQGMPSRYSVLIVAGW